MDIKTQTRVRPETSPVYWVPRYQEWLTLSQIAYRKQQEAAESKENGIGGDEPEILSWDWKNGKWELLTGKA